MFEPMPLLLTPGTPALPRYRIEGVLGSGPDGPVVRAVAERLGARPVAVRCLSLPDGAGRRLLRIHSETIAGLDHDGLACVHDVVEIDDTTLALVTAEAEHGTLADRLVLGPLPVEEAAPLVRTVARALAAAHAAGLTHRRLHAGNILLTDAGPAITDLAQAAAVGRPSRTGDPAADDLSDLGRLAHDLVDGGDPLTGAFRAACARAIAGELDGPGAFADALEGTHPGEPSDASAACHRSPAGQPVVRTKRLGLVVAAAMVVGVCLGAAPTIVGSALDAGSSRPEPAAEAAAATSAPSATRWSPTTAELTVVTDEGPVRYRIGAPGDALVVGDWDCDGVETPGLYRPATGETFLFDDWARDEAVSATPGPVLEPGGDAAVRTEGGCDHVAVSDAS
jgi:hypothetical protein